MAVLLAGVVFLVAALVLAMDALWNARVARGVLALGAMVLGAAFLFGG